jgi:hypothetical protein
LVTDLDHDLDRARLLGCADHASYIGLGYLGGAAWHLSLSLCGLDDCGGHHAAARDDGLASPLHLWGADEFSELAAVSSDRSAKTTCKFVQLGLLHGLRNSKGRRGGGLHRHWVQSGRYRRGRRFYPAGICFSRRAYGSVVYSPARVLPEVESVGNAFEVLAQTGLLDVEALGIAPMRDVTAHALDDRAQLGGDVAQCALPLKWKSPGTQYPELLFPTLSFFPQ